MAKQHNRKRHYKKRARFLEDRERRAKSYAENYYKQQSTTINKLKYAMAAAMRVNNRTAQAERDSRNAARTEENE